MRPYVLFSLFGEFLESGHDSAVLHRTIELSPGLNRARRMPASSSSVEAIRAARNALGAWLVDLCPDERGRGRARRAGDSARRPPGPAGQARRHTLNPR